MTEGELRAESPLAPTSQARADARPYLGAYISRLKESGALSDPAVERAFRRVPRHLFVERFFVGDGDEGWRRWSTSRSIPSRSTWRRSTPRRR